MTLTETFNHILHLTLLWVRHKSHQDKQETLLKSPQSISTPLGVESHFRRVDATVRLEDGIDRARNRNYAVRECKRLQNNEGQEKHIPTQ